MRTFTKIMLPGLFVLFQILAPMPAFAGLADLVNSRPVQTPTVGIDEIERNQPAVESDEEGGFEAGPLSEVEPNDATPEQYPHQRAVIIEQYYDRDFMYVYCGCDHLIQFQKYVYDSKGQIIRIRTDYVNRDTGKVFAVQKEKYENGLLVEQDNWVKSGPPGNEVFRLTEHKEFNKKTGVNNKWITFERDDQGRIFHILDKTSNGSVKTMLTYDIRGKFLSKQTYHALSSAPPLGPVTAESRRRTTNITIDLQPRIEIARPSKPDLKNKLVSGYERYLR